jgi:hypothetical protein
MLIDKACSVNARSPYLNGIAFRDQRSTYPGRRATRAITRRRPASNTPAINVRSTQSSAPPPWLDAVTVSVPDAATVLLAFCEDVSAPAAIELV